MPDVGAQSMVGGWAAAQHANGTGACFSYLVGDPIVPAWGRLSPEGWYNVVFCAMQLLSMGGLLGVVVKSDRAARRGDYAATKRLILPVYHRIVYALVTFDFLSVVMVVFRLAGKAGDAQNTGVVPGQDEDYLADEKSLFIGADWAILHWVVDGVAVFLCQPSAGQRAMYRSVGVGFLPALGSFGMGYLKHRETNMPNDSCVLDRKCVEGTCSSKLECFYVPMVYQLLLLLAYVRVWLAPGRDFWVFTRVYRREAAVAYVRFWAIFRMLTLTASALLIQPFSVQLVDVGFCMDFCVEAFVFTLGTSYFIYKALRDDSAFWQCETAPDGTGGPRFSPERSRKSPSQSAAACGA